MNLYELSSIYTDPTHILNKCRELQTPAPGFDLSNWFEKILEIDKNIIVMKDHPFFGDQVILPVCHKHHYHRPSLWIFDPTQWELNRGSLCREFSKNMYLEKSYHLGMIVRKRSSLTKQLDNLIDQMDLSFHKIFNDSGLFRDRTLPGLIMFTAHIHIRYFLCNDRIYCILGQIRVRAQNRIHTVFDFEQIARNYDHDQILHEGSIEVEAIQEW